MEHAEGFLKVGAAYRRELNVLLSRGLRRMFRIADTEYRRTLEAHALLDFSDLVQRAVDLLRRMEELRLSAQRMIERGQEPTPEMEQELDQLLSKVQVAPSYQRAIAAQENFDKVMMQVNGWIAEGIKSGAMSSIITLG